MHAFGHTGYVHIPAQKRVQGDKFAPRAERGHLVGMIGESIYLMWIPETDKIVTTASVKFDKYGAVQSTPDLSTPPSKPCIGCLQPLINRITEAPQLALGGEDEDLVLPEVGHAGDNFDGFVDDNPVEVAPTRGNNVAPRRHEIHADFDQANIMEGPRNRRARAHFTTPTFSYCFAMAIIRPTARLADMPPEPPRHG
ncbi:hypothetical protein EJ02DRAFT_479745 [Clathrospora elynae]|uniref:Retroviral polymerase SH3-like domain-containing protein n=1 Tax=Clathrospora elynae TaxID=706981 RepID=A0A6A5SAH7_9PLEO|nr:hypothetical protein EJ02DRAFT_479745 [Clathrospora elynae]